MNQNGISIPNAIFMTLIGGATLGGLVAAFTTMKSSKNLRNGIISLAGQFNPKAGRTAPMDDESVQVAFT